MNQQSTITSTVGYMGLALTGWLLSMPNAGWFDKVYGHGTAMTYPLAVILAIIAILAYLNSRTLDAVIFFGGSGLFWSGHVYLGSVATGASDPGAYSGWYFFIWAVYFAYIWLGSFKAGSGRILFLLGLWLTLLALAVGDWSSQGKLTMLGGYLGLITSIIAAIVSADSIIRAQRSQAVPA